MSENTVPNSLRFLPDPVASPVDDPFREDVFGRKKLAENLTTLLATFTEQPFVLGINGIWGSGKTKFLEMWGKHLKAQGFSTLHFNAWENDHSDDPFASVLSEFRKLAESENESQKSRPRKMWDKVVKKSLPVLERAAAGAVKNLTLGILDLKSADAEAIISNLAEESAKHALARCEANKKSIDAFRSELQAFVKAEGCIGKPVVYLVDELDRCRPTFAIAVLERIKHLLNVPGVVFVFAWDRQQLNGTIQAIYGPQTDPGGYLLRIIDLELNLPRGDYAAFSKALMKRFGLIEYLYSIGCHESVVLIQREFSFYAKIFELSIREQEKAFTALSISCRIGFLENDSVIKVMLLLIMLRLKKPDAYHAICHMSEHYEKLVKVYLPNILGVAFWNSEQGAYLEGVFLYELPAEVRGTRVDELRSRIQNLPARQNPSRDSMIFDGYILAQNFRGRGGLVTSLIKQMEFTENFWSY